jgi:hypothetical protein
MSCVEHILAERSHKPKHIKDSSVRFLEMNIADINLGHSISTYRFQFSISIRIQ